MQNVNFSIDNFSTLQNPRAHSSVNLSGNFSGFTMKDASSEKVNNASGRSFMDLVKADGKNPLQPEKTSDLREKSETQNLAKSDSAVKKSPEKVEEKVSEKKVSDFKEKTAEKAEKIENSKKVENSEILADETENAQIKDEDRLLITRYSQFQQLLDEGKADSEIDVEGQSELSGSINEKFAELNLKEEIAARTDTAEKTDDLSREDLSAANFFAPGSAEETANSRISSEILVSEISGASDNQLIKDKEDVSEFEKNDGQSEKNRKTVKIGEKIAFDVTDLRTKPAEADQNASKIKADSAKADFKTDVAYSGGNSVQFTVSMNQNAANADILSSNSQAASAAGSNFQAMLENMIESNAQDFAKAGSIVLRDNNVGNISLILHPESLGNVKINLELSDKVVTGHITVASKEAMQAFESNLNNLKTAFTQGGFENASFDLSMAGGNAGGFGNGSENASRNMQQLTNKVYGDYAVSSLDSVTEAESGIASRFSDYSVDIVA